MRVIGLTGLAKSGKDTVAQTILHRYIGKTAIRQGFADALKHSAARLFNPSCTVEGGIEFCNFLKEGVRVQLVEDTPGGWQVFSDISGRQFLQRYGTEAHRDVFGDDFWLDAVLPEGRDDCDVLVIPDVRFENEAQRIRDRGGELWLIRRPGIEAVESHASENGVSHELITTIIENRGTLDDLERAVIRQI